MQPSSGFTTMSLFCLPTSRWLLLSELKSNVFLNAMNDDIVQTHFVSVKDIKFKPGSIVIQSSESESNDIVSSNPMNVKLGAVEDDTSTLSMKSRAPYYDFAGI